MNMTDLKAAIDKVRTTADAVRSTVDKIAPYVKPLPVIGQYAEEARIAIDALDAAVDGLDDGIK